MPMILVVALLLLATGRAQDAVDVPLEGHSHLGEAFNEGPRQHAYLMGNTGNIDFPVTTSSDDAQKFFAQGMGQLHGFWYFESERSFRQVAFLDPACAMAYWGMGMANVDHEDRAAGFAHEAWKRRAVGDDRERRFIDSLARFYEVDRPRKEGKTPEPRKKLTPAQQKKRRRRYVKDLEALIYEYPENVEAKAILVNQLWLDSRKGIPIHSRQANQALLSEVFASNPMHPAHHYRIHLWDTKETAHRVVSSAALSGHSAPGVAHLWHMGGHVFDQLGRYEDTAWQQEASARVDHARMMRDRVMPYQIHNYAHNNEWLCRSLRNVGRIHDALDLARNMIEQPRHPKLNNPERRGAANYGRRRLMETLFLGEMWDLTVELCGTMYLESGRTPKEEAERSLHLCRAHLMLGNLQEANEVLEDVRGQVEAARKERSRRVDEAESVAKEDGADEKAIRKAMTGALENGTQVVRDIERTVDTLEMLAGFCDGGHDKAAESLKKLRYSDLHSSLLLLGVGLKKQAEESARKAAKGTRKAVPLANLAHVLWECGKQDEAKRVFEDLRSMSARFDLDVNCFERLAPIARELGQAADWRVPLEVPDDVGQRPPLDSLGTFRWAPVPADSWQLPLGDGRTVGLENYEGKPVLLVFFLGFGCVHCVEQLDALKPMFSGFEKAGISIATIGTDTMEQVTTSLASGEKPLPFPVLCDPGHEVFKQYRCWDDFEGLPLHGTFLIDETGLVRWQDISFEPFMETSFLLEECKRLLALPVGRSQPNGTQDNR